MKLFRKFLGWNEREIHAKEDEDYFNDSDEEDKLDGDNNKSQSSKGLHSEPNYKDKSNTPTPNSTPNITYLKLESNIISRSQSEEKIEDNKLLSKKHGLDKIALYEDNYLNANENVDYVTVGSGSKIF